MRHGTTNRRQRNKSNGSRRSNQQRMQVFDSNGPDVRIRGTAHQVAEKYLALAKDAYSAGDRIMAESYFQHAEHYIRIINEISGEFTIRRNEDEEMQDGNKMDAGKNKPQKVQEREDLGLPASILGETSNNVGPDKAVRQKADATE